MATEGYYNGVVESCVAIEHRFNEQNAFEFELSVMLYNAQNQPFESIKTYLEFSNRFGTGNNASRTQAKMTMDVLHNIGLVGDDLSQANLDTIKNKTCRINCKTKDKDGKDCAPRYFITTSKPIVRIANANDRARSIIAAMTVPSAMTTAPSATGQVPANPFGCQHATQTDVNPFMNL